MKKTLLGLLVIFMGFGFVMSAAFAGDSFKQIKTKELVKMIEDQSIVVVDANTEAVFKKNHIPGAVYFDAKDEGMSFLPKDKSAKLAFYCKNTHCTASHMAARLALSKGYKNVYVYSDGIDGWMASGNKIEN